MNWGNACIVGTQGLQPMN